MRIAGAALRWPGWRWLFLACPVGLVVGTYIFNATSYANPATVFAANVVYHHYSPGELQYRHAGMTIFHASSFAAIPLGIVYMLSAICRQGRAILSVRGAFVLWTASLGVTISALLILGYYETSEAYYWERYYGEPWPGALNPTAFTIGLVVSVFVMTVALLGIATVNVLVQMMRAFHRDVVASVAMVNKAEC